MNQCATEITLDPPPSARKVSIRRRQGKNRVQVIWQNDDCIDREWSLSTRRPEGIAQVGNVIDKSV